MQIGSKGSVFLPISITERRARSLGSDNGGGSGDKEHLDHLRGTPHRQA